jgi:hypothetical protein
MHAVRQHNRNGNVMRVAGGFERGDDVVGVVRRIGQPSEDPRVETVSFRQGTLPGRIGAALMRVNMLAGGTAELPDAGIGGALGMPQFDRAGGPVDRDAGVAQHQRYHLQDDIGVGDLARLAEQPVTHRQRLAQSLVGKDGCWLRRGIDHCHRPSRLCPEMKS